MKKFKVILTAFAVTFAGLTAIADVNQTSSAIDPLINDIGLRSATIETVNELVADVTAIATNIAAQEDSIGLSAIQVNTNAEIPTLTVIVPLKAGSVLLMPNSTNTFTLTGSQVNDTGVVSVIYRLRSALNVDGTTNGWVKQASHVQ